MITRFYSGAKSEILPEIEKFRELQAFCSHDLRSQVGAVSGLLQLLREQISALDDKTKSSYAAAMVSAQEALGGLDETVAETKPLFDCVWLVGFTKNELSAMDFEAALGAEPIKRAQPVLFLNFETTEEWRAKVRKYRPIAVFFKNRDVIGKDPSLWINRLGPQMTKIYLLDTKDAMIEGVRPEAVTLLEVSSDLSAFSAKILEAIEGLPHGRR